MVRERKKDRQRERKRERIEFEFEFKFIFISQRLQVRQDASFFIWHLIQNYNLSTAEKYSSNY